MLHFHNFGGTNTKSCSQYSASTLSLTNLLQSLSGLLFALCFALPFQFGQLSASHSTDGPAGQWARCMSAYHLANQIQWPSFSSPKKRFLKSASEWGPPVVRCVFTVIVVSVFCLCASHGFRVNFISIFRLRHPSHMCIRMHQNKTIRFLTKIYDPPELTHLTQQSKES